MTDTYTDELPDELVGADPADATDAPNPDDLLPPRRSLAGWLVAAGVVAAGLAAATDPAGPAARLKLAEKLGLPAGWAWPAYLPYAVAAAGAVGLGLAALTEARRVGAWVARRQDAAPAGDWYAPAYEWSKARLPEQHGHDHIQTEVRRGAAYLSDRLASRWGAYYATAFAVILVTFLAGLAGLRADAARGAAGPPYRAFWPLAVATAGVGVGLFVVVVSARRAVFALGTWRAAMEVAAVREFEPAGRLGAGSGDVTVNSTKRDTPGDIGDDMPVDRVDDRGPNVDHDRAGGSDDDLI